MRVVLPFLSGFLLVSILWIQSASANDRCEGIKEKNKLEDCLDELIHSPEITSIPIEGGSSEGGGKGGGTTMRPSGS
ncbi:MAG: hypothetical protein ABJP82_12200 [Hyphomicrobiales bacterium]